MYPYRVEVAPERRQLSFQVLGIPIEQLVQILLADAANEALDKWVRPGHKRDRLHSLDTQDTEIGLPTLEPKERVMIKAQSDGQTLPAMAWLNMRQSATPSTATACTPKPMI